MPLSNAPAGRLLSLERSPHYWLRRAEQHRQKGEYRRAAVLLRHAVELEPASGDLRVEYAETLRDMSCFEASNRAAFSALALEPGGFVPYHLIGRNMLSLGREQEALDAFAHYLSKARSQPRDDLDWFWEEDETLFELETMLDRGKGLGTARYDALTHIASQRLARGRMEGARKALLAASRHDCRDGRLSSLWAMFHQAEGRHQEALEPAQLAVRQNPSRVPALCALASVRMQLGQRGLAAGALLFGALHCRYPYQEQLFCLTATALGLEDIAMVMLRHNRRVAGDRLPTLFNMAVVLLSKGRRQEAVAYLQLCRELDPEDICAQYMLEVVRDWDAQDLSPQEQRQKATGLMFYPMLPPLAEQRLLQGLALRLEEGLESFALALPQDDNLQRAFLYAVSMPGATLGRLLPAIAAQLLQTSPSDGESLLRSVLWQPGMGQEGKRMALSVLLAIGAKPPFGIWRKGRIVQIDPQTAPERTPSVLQRLLCRRIRAAQAMVGDSAMTPFALALLCAMGRSQRYAFATDVGQVWQHALVKVFALTHGYDASCWAFDEPLSPQLQKRFARACQALYQATHRVAAKKEESHELD